MNKILGTILAGLFALQAGLPSLGLIAGLVYFLKDTTAPLPTLPPKA